jgi:hypothetical protein
MTKPKYTESDVKDLLRELDAYLAKAYSAYVHELPFYRVTDNPRLTLDEVSTLQSKIRLITEE